MPSPLSNPEKKEKKGSIPKTPAKNWVKKKKRQAKIKTFLKAVYFLFFNFLFSIASQTEKNKDNKTKKRNK